jgi:hypothetical protein
MVETYGDLLHRVIRIYILNLFLNNMPNRIYFDANIIEFFNIYILSYPSRKNAVRRIKEKYKKHYRILMLDNRFEFRIKSENNIGIYSTTFVNDIGNNVFVGSFTKQLSQEDAYNHPSSVQRSLISRSNNVSKARLSQYWVLIGSIAFLNHACNNCSQLLPFQVHSTNENVQSESMFRTVTQYRIINQNDEVCISYSDNDNEIQYHCCICFH